MIQFRIEPLDDRHERSAFASGEESLDRYFQSQVTPSGNKHFRHSQTIIYSQYTMDYPHDTIRPIQWREDRLWLLDQRLLPQQETWLPLNNAKAVAAAITDMVVRGAPAIGVTAAFGVVLAVRARYRQDPENWKRLLQADLDLLAAARPTAVNLAWALTKMTETLPDIDGDPTPVLLARARAIHDQDIAANRAMGALGSALIEAGSGVLTHCNTGSLATAGYGTALGVIRSAYAAGKLKAVYADETRPWLQGARLTAWELVHDGIPVQLLADGAAAWLMRQGRVQWVIVGSDRIAANGDVANKIGTYGLAVAARWHGIPFMVAAPTSTIDPQIADGGDIPIETRPTEEVLGCGGRTVAAEGAGAWNPVFDVTPAELVDAIVTERGVVRNPDRDKIARLLSFSTTGE